MKVGLSLIWVTWGSIFAVILFPPLLVLIPIPLVFWWWKWRSATGGLGQFRRDAREEYLSVKRVQSSSAMFDRPAGWYGHFEEKGHVARWWDGERWSRHRFDRRAGVRLPLAPATGVEAEREAFAALVESERALMAGAPAGWFRHPREGKSVLRYWDGQGWTEHRWDWKRREYLSPATW